VDRDFTTPESRGADSAVVPTFIPAFVSRHCVEIVFAATAYAATAFAGTATVIVIDSETSASAIAWVGNADGDGPGGMPVTTIRGWIGGGGTNILPTMRTARARFKLLTR
jgi:hypothetical protein